MQALPMRLTRIEGRRLLWDCVTCETANRTRLSRRGRRALLAMLVTVGGSRISEEEIRTFARNLRGIDSAIATELLDA